MSTLLKNVFLLIGTLVVSLLLYTLVMGTPGRLAIWSTMQPIFQHNWSANTFNDGRVLTGVKNAEFQQVVAVNTTNPFTSSGS